MNRDLPQGWLTPPEADELRRLANGKVVLELGAWQGRSTVVLSEAARYVVSVDTHRGIAEVGGEDSLGAFVENLRHRENVAIVVARFEDFVPLLAQHFDLVYIDGNHDFDSVYRDTCLAIDLSPDWIAFHDWDFAEVREAAAAALGQVVGDPVSLVGSVASFRGPAMP